MSGEEAKQPARVRLAELVGAHRHRAATVGALAIALLLAFHVMAGRNGLSAFQQKRLRDQALRREIDQLAAENARLRGHVDHLRSDPDAIEREARERLHYTRPDEVIYTLNDRPAPASR